MPAPIPKLPSQLDAAGPLSGTDIRIVQQGAPPVKQTTLADERAWFLIGIPTAAEVAADYQPLNSGLSAISALTTQAFGRSLLELANAAGGRTALGLGTSAVLDAGAANGVAPLDSGAKIATTYLPDSIVGQVEYKGTWNPATDTPTLPAADVSNKGWYYIASADGVWNTIDFKTGDWVISDGTLWSKVDNTDAVTSFNSRLGAIIPLVGDYAAFYQPLDADLTAIAALTTAAFGRGLLTETSVASIKTTLGFLQEPDIRTLDSRVWSAGILEAGDYVTEASTTTVDVAAGEGLFRTSASATAPIVRLSWAQSLGLSTPLNSVRYVGINYNAGTPVAFVTTAFADFDWYTKFPLAKVYNNGIKMHVVNANAHSEDTANLTRQMLRQCFPFRSTQSPEGGGLALGSPTGRYITVSAGSAWHGFNEYPIPAFDSQTAQRFDTVWRDGGSGFNSTANVQVWPNTQIDDGTGTLLTMTNNRYGCLWWYIDVEDGDVKMIYGRDQYVTFLQAEQEAPPSTSPLGLNEHSVLLGRIIFQKSAASGVVQSALDNLFQTQGISVHNELSSLQGGGPGVYYHLTDAQHVLATQLASGSQSGLLSSTDWSTFNGKVPTGAITTSGLTQATSRLLGRATAGTGAIEEIALGYGMQFASGELRTPQDLRDTSSPSFAGLAVSGNPTFGRFFQCTHTTNPFYRLMKTDGTPRTLDVNGGDSYQVTWALNGSGSMAFDYNGNLEINIGSFKTGSPSGGTAQPWKLGDYSGGLVNTEINGSARKLVVGDQPIQTKGYTVGTLPAGTVGQIAHATDLLTPAFLTAAVGGGAVVGPVFYNGAAWVAI